MNSEKIEKIYNQIKEELFDAAPESWTDVYVYAKIEDEQGLVESFYVDEKNGEMVQLEGSDNLFELFCQYYDVYREEAQEIWTVATFIMNKDGEYNIKLDYKSRPNMDDVEQIILWQYKHMEIMPEEEYNYLIEIAEEELEEENLNVN